LTPTITLRKLSKSNCRPCAVLTHYLEQIAVDLLALEVEVDERNVDNEPELAAHYGLTSVPVLIVERNGREVARRVGLTSPEEILDIVKNAKEGDE
jgi:thioredoxin 1